MTASEPAHNANQEMKIGGHAPPPEVTETVAHYDQSAACFAAKWDTVHLAHELETFARRVAGQRLVLDLGCGPGRDSAYLIELGCHVVGLDLSTGMLSQARQRKPAVPLVQADQRLLPFSPVSLDGVWACASLLHLPRAQLLPALAEVARVLRQPGGILFLAMKGGQGEHWVIDADGQRRFFTFYTTTEIETLLRQARFQILESRVAPDRAGRDYPWINILARL